MFGVFSVKLRSSTTDPPISDAQAQMQRRRQMTRDRQLSNGSTIRATDRRVPSQRHAGVSAASIAQRMRRARESGTLMRVSVYSQRLTLGTNAS